LEDILPQYYGIDKPLLINKRGAHDDMIRIRRTISATLISGLTAHENYDILNVDFTKTLTYYAFSHIVYSFL
jgi:hypothetical protein